MLKKIILIMFLSLFLVSLARAGRPNDGSVTGTADTTSNSGHATGEVTGTASTGDASNHSNSTSAASGTYTGSGSSSGPAFTIKTPTLEDYCKKTISQGGFVKYDGACGGGNGYDNLISTSNVVLKWVVNIALLIAAAMAFYAGWLYIASATDPSARSKANSIFKGIAIGLFLIFAAWLIVKFILTMFAKGNATTSDTSAAGNFSGLQE